MYVCVYMHKNYRSLNNIYLLEKQKRCKRERSADFHIIIYLKIL